MLFICRFNWILSACQGNSEGDGPGKGCGFYDITPNTQQYKDMGTQVCSIYLSENRMR